MKDVMSTGIIAAAFLLVFFSSIPSHASPTEAEKVQARLLKAYKSLKSFKEEATITTVTGGKVLKINSTLTFSRPNKVNWKAKGQDAEGKVDIMFCSDGKSLYRYNAVKKEYMRKAALPLSELSSEGFGFDGLILTLLDGKKTSLAAAIGGYEPSSADDGSRLICEGKNKENLIVLALVKETESSREVLKYYIDPATSLLIRMEGDIKNGKQQASIKASLRYAEIGSSFNSSVFRFTPPGGAREKGR
ncbi:MAG: outer membrane lipoprotein carrier protein LolA [Candidatus Xenobiia bacterium LiM19]